MLIRYRWFSQVNIKTLQLQHNSIFKEGKEEIDDTRSKSFFSKQKFIFEKRLQTDFVCAVCSFIRIPFFKVFDIDTIESFAEFSLEHGMKQIIEKKALHLHDSMEVKQKTKTNQTFRVMQKKYVFFRSSSAVAWFY